MRDGDALTLAIHDPVFIKFKPTAVYGVFALALPLFKAGERMTDAQVREQLGRVDATVQDGGGQA